MRFKFISLRGTAPAAIAVALIAAGSATAQRETRNASQGTALSPTYNVCSQGAKPASQVKDPVTTLASAKVQDSSGQTVGRVKSVITSTDGKASTVNVALTTRGGGGRVVEVNANGLRYDSDTKTLKTSLTETQINSFPVTQSP